MMNFNESMRSLVSEIILHLEEFHFIDLEQVGISATYSKNEKQAGLLAYLLPLRYQDGSPITKRELRGQVYHYGVSPVHHGGRELLYIIYFMLPRFLKLSFQEKLDTVIHELFHISPLFNGDLRRLRGRSHLHGKSLKEYDKNIRVLSERFLNLADPEGPVSFLRGRVAVDYESFHIPEPRPKLIHVE